MKPEELDNLLAFFDWVRVYPNDPPGHTHTGFDSWTIAPADRDNGSWPFELPRGLREVLYLGGAFLDVNVVYVPTPPNQ